MPQRRFSHTGNGSDLAGRDVMGCDFGKPTVVSSAHEEPEVQITGFSDTQIDTIRSTWPLLARDSTRVGVDVFKRIFREAPSIHSLFHSFHIHHVEDLYQSAMFREHAGRFMLILQTFVDHLENPHHIDDQLLILGAKHATFDGYHPEYFRFYTKCMLDVWETELGEEFIHEVRDSWGCAFDYIVDRMTEGFDMCLSGQIQEVLHGSLLVGGGRGGDLEKGMGDGEEGGERGRGEIMAGLSGRRGRVGSGGVVAEMTEIDVDDGLVRVH